MDKLKLTPEEQVIFKRAITGAYKAGKLDVSSLFSGMTELFQGEDVAVKKVIEDYSEKE